MASGTFKRWTTFNAVGAIGVVFQLATLTLLLRALHVHYLVATVLAVELTLLHNFVWHERWTWRDRPAAVGTTRLRRLLAFQAFNGTVSLVGNVAIAAALTGIAKMNPLAANAVAIVSCSLINFAASDRLVFRTSAVALALTLLASPASAENWPSKKTLDAWQAYQAAIDGRYNSAAGARFAFDAVNPVPRWRERIRAGELVMESVDAPDAPDGKIHHWIGAVFVPRATVDAVVRKLQDNAGKESSFYEDVTASKLLGRDGETVRVFMKLRRTAIITVTYNTEHTVEYRHRDATHATSRSVATKIAELSEPGTPKEREKGPDEDRGFLWRLNAYWRFEQTADGVIIECESVSLSRSVPVLVRAIASPIVGKIAKESLEKTLDGLRRFLAQPSNR